MTRLSIGVQTFDDAALARIGRVHDGAQARAAITEAAATFDTFNIDLMYALPQQTLAALIDDVDAALAFAPPHLSIYHLTLEPNTRFAAQPPAGLPDDDAASDMLDAIVARTAAAGLARYEVSAFARVSTLPHTSTLTLRYLCIVSGAHATDLCSASCASALSRTRLQTRAGLQASSRPKCACRLPFEFMLGRCGSSTFCVGPLRAAHRLPPSSLQPAADALTRGLIE